MLTGKQQADRTDMNSGNTSRGPSVAELQKIIRDGRSIEVILVTGQKIRGRLKWFDDTAFCLIMDDGETITLLRSAVLGYRMVGGKQAAAAPQAAAPQAQQAAAAPQQAQAAAAQAAPPQQAPPAKPQS